MKSLKTVETIRIMSNPRSGKLRTINEDDDVKSSKIPRAPLTYFNDGGFEGFFGVWNFGLKDFLASIEVTRIFSVCNKKKKKKRYFYF